VCSKCKSEQETDGITRGDYKTIHLDAELVFSVEDQLITLAFCYDDHLLAACMCTGV